MANFIKDAVKSYEEVMTGADPRVGDWLLMSTPWPSLMLTISYVLVVKWLLPRFMANRPAYAIKELMIAYNFIMVVFSGYLVWEFAWSGWLVGYSFRCQPVDYSTKPNAIRMARASYWFHMLKYVEFLDTVFFVLRKKMSHVTFLHVFHHASMPWSVWWGIKFVPGGHGTLFAMVNSMVHFVMYIYYGISAMGPQYQKYLWWKKYLTKFQLTQFFLLSIHSSQLFFIECDYPVIFAWAILFYGVLFFAMFLDFYAAAYRAKSKTRQAKKEQGSDPGVKNGHAHTMNGLHASNGVFNGCMLDNNNQRLESRSKAD